MRLRDSASTIGAYQATCQQVLAASDQQERLIESLLILARSQRGLDHRESIDSTPSPPKQHKNNCISPRGLGLPNQRARVSPEHTEREVRTGGCVALEHIADLRKTSISVTRRGLLHSQQPA